MRNGVRNVLFLTGGLAAGFAIAMLLRPSGNDDDWMGSPAASLESRVAELEWRLAAEAAAWLELSAAMVQLRDELEAVAAAGPPAAEPAAEDRLARALRGAAAAPSAAAEPSSEAPAPRLAEARERIRRALPTPEEQEQRRMQRFVDAGFSVARAEWIEQRTAELRMQQLEAQYEAARSGDAARARQALPVDQTLRAELGDSEYERYLEAIGRPTRINVRDVLTGSPAEQVGLRRGDEIVSYGGRRVFDMEDLNRLTLEGRPGDAVVVEVLRDGQPMQLYLPRGPVGISGGGRRWP